MIDHHALDIGAIERWIKLNRMLDKLNILMEDAARKRAERMRRQKEATPIFDWAGGRSFPPSS